MSSDASIPSPAENDSDILCPLCDYNLRGLTEPRCPECGHRSTWEELRNRPPLHPYLFEHHPESNVWSFLYTLFGSLRPMRFWRSVKPAMPPRTGRLIVFGLICLLLGVAATTYGILDPITQQAQQNAAFRQRIAQLFTARSNLSSRTYYPAMAARLQAIIRQYGSLDAYLNQLHPPLRSPLFWKQAWQTSLWRSAGQEFRGGWVALLWMPLTIASLLIFRASMRQAKIRTGHVLRCVLYTGAPICLFGIYLLAAMPLSSLIGSADWRYTRFGYVDDIELSCVMFLLMLAVRLMFAYRLYLRFHYAIATVIASQIIVALALLNIDIVFGH